LDVDADCNKMTSEAIESIIYAEAEKKMDDLKIDADAVKEAGAGDEDQVDPWNVESKDEKGIDYEKLISKLSNIYISASPLHHLDFSFLL
jgi:hypothetical protein